MKMIRIGRHDDELEDIAQSSLAKQFAQEGQNVLF
jgi:hypothetical protein